MIQLGEYHTMSVERETQPGFFLEDGDGETVLMPRSLMREGMKIGDVMQVFVYGDAEGRPVATAEEPLITVGSFAVLRVTEVSEIGAFCDWGISKDLLVPFRNQAVPMEAGRDYVVHMYLDSVRKRLVGTTRLHPFLADPAEQDFSMGQEVDLMVWAENDLGYQVVVDGQYPGLVYRNEVPRKLRFGQKCKGYVKPLREDGKLDISLYPLGHESIEPNAQKILEELEENGGFLPFTDKSDPNVIRAAFGISKKLFKKSLGALYKQKLVELKADGIYRV